MTASTLTDTKINRRIAARIYEQSNLFYRKIDRASNANAQSSFDTLLAEYPTEYSTVSDTSLPVSQSQENDTLNVNISATGIAFTCNERHLVGDYLLLRILMLSSMTVIMTSCRVVYCKPSNPYETDRYPYSIGAEFINMTAEDSALLDRHVRRKLKQQLAINGSLFTVVAAILLNPLETAHLALESGHHLLEIAAHGLYLIFEYLEMSLDHVIEHLFHTEVHETQVIVFYILMTGCLIGLYFMGRRIPSASVRFINKQRLFWSRKQASALYYWKEQSTLDKFKIIGLSSVTVFAYVFFAL